MLVTFDALAVDVVLVKPQVGVRTNRIKMTSVVFSNEWFSTTYARFVFIPEPNELVKNLL
jgi:hypothetical protein